MVDQMVTAFNESEKFILTIAPEGTRHQVVEWKRGFYYIAQGAGVPIVMAVVDGRHKTINIVQVFHPTDNVEADMKAIQSYFLRATGIKPRRKYITLEN
jgi:1-acyl-sn-glycerol-3-phosphate acyltransferase